MFHMKCHGWWRIRGVVFVVTPDLRAPMIILRRSDGKRVGAIETLYFVSGAEISFTGLISNGVHSLELSSPLLLSPELAQPRTLPIFPSSQRNVDRLNDCGAIAMCFSFCFAFDFPVERPMLELLGRSSSDSLPCLSPGEIIEMPKRIYRENQIPDRQCQEIDQHPEHVNNFPRGD